MPLSGARHTETCLRAYADSEGPDQPAASAHSNQGLHCPLTESLDTTECLNGEQRPGSYVVHAQDDLNLRKRMPEGTFSLDAANLKLTVSRQWSQTTTYIASIKTSEAKVTKKKAIPSNTITAAPSQTYLQTPSVTTGATYTANRPGPEVAKNVFVLNSAEHVLGLSNTFQTNTCEFFLAKRS